MKPTDIATCGESTTKSFHMKQPQCAYCKKRLANSCGKIICRITGRAYSYCKKHKDHVISNYTTSLYSAAANVMNKYYEKHKSLT